MTDETKRVLDRAANDADFRALCSRIDLSLDNYIDDDIIDLGIYLQARGEFERPIGFPKRGTLQHDGWVATAKASREKLRGQQ